MNCRECIRLLGVWRDGELDDALTREVERHLEVCENCRAELASSERLSSVLISEYGAAPPLNLAERAFQAAMEAGPRSRSFLGALFPMAWPAALASSLVALILVGFTLVAQPGEQKAEDELFQQVLSLSSSDQVQGVLQGALGLEGLSEGDTDGQ